MGQSLKITGLVASIITLLMMGVVVAQDATWKDCELGARNPDRSIAACSKILKRSSNAAAFHHRALAFEAKGKLDQAISDVSAGIRLDPQPAYRWQKRGELYARQGKYQQAVADITEAIRRDPTPRAFRFQSRADAYQGLGDLTRAIADYDEAIRLDPQARSFRFHARANALRDAGLYDRALADYETALKLAPTSVWALVDRGRTYARMGRYEGAKSDFDDALTLDPSNADLRPVIEMEVAALPRISSLSIAQEHRPQSPRPQQPAPPQPPPQRPGPVQRTEGVGAAPAKPSAEPPKQYSIVEVANESRACRPAFSNNCITLTKGERVVVVASQIDDKPRRGLYCLRPMNMIECYYADLTAIEINGIPVPTIGMAKPAPDQRVGGPASTVAPSQETPPRSPPPRHPPPTDTTAESAKKGDAGAQIEMGNRYASGQTVPKDDTKAASWYRKAAEQGNANAQYLLARMYFEGRGVAQDEAKAFQWYLEAAEQGNVGAKYALGLMYDYGQGTEKDGAKALQWYQKAAAQGSQDAKDRLDARATLLARLRSTREIIATRVGILLTESDRAKVEESAARFAGANDRTALIDLKALGTEADDVLRIFGEAEEFASVSEIAAKRAAVIESELKQITSDAPVVLRLEAAIDAVKEARAGSDLRVLQSSLGELNETFDRSRSTLDKLKFYHP